MVATLKELANQYAKKQPKMVDTLTEEAPILQLIPFEEASHGLWNVYEDVSGVSGPSFVDMNAALPSVTVDSDLKKIDLNILGGEMEVPEDTATMFGGKTKYFTKKMDVILREAGKTAEQKILYDNFRQYAIDNSNTIDAGAATNDCYSIVAVRFVKGVTTGLYSPHGFKQGAMMDVQPINNGGLYKSTQAATSGVLVYGIRMKAFFGLQIADSKTVGAIVNINSSNVPTEAEINELIATVRGRPENTKLFMHDKCKNLLYSHKNDQMHMTPLEKDFNTLIDKWNGIPIHTSYNFYDGTEDAVS